ncbi:MAG: hypothetical protein AB1796_13375 [Bacillota bacterium]
MRIKYPFLYDALLLPFELLLIRRWRRHLWSQLPGSHRRRRQPGNNVPVNDFAVGQVPHHYHKGLAVFQGGYAQVPVDYIIAAGKNIPYQLVAI